MNATPFVHSPSAFGFLLFYWRLLCLLFRRRSVRYCLPETRLFFYYPGGGRSVGALFHHTIIQSSYHTAYHQIMTPFFFCCRLFCLLSHRCLMSVFIFGRLLSFLIIVSAPAAFLSLYPPWNAGPVCCCWQFNTTRGRQCWRFGTRCELLMFSSRSLSDRRTTTSSASRVSRPS